MEQHLKKVVISQYKASLRMLKDAIDGCEEDLWETKNHYNQSWQIAYHALFFTDLYLSDGEHSFVPWKKHRDDLQRLGPMPMKDGDSRHEPYSKNDILDYVDLCMQKIEPALFHLSSTSPSGFHWLPFDKLELQFYNIRHIQHHAAQLIARIRENYGKGIGWCGWD